MELHKLTRLEEAQHIFNFNRDLTFLCRKVKVKNKSITRGTHQLVVVHHHQLDVLGLSLDGALSSPHL